MKSLLGKSRAAGLGCVCVCEVEGGGAVIQGVMPPAHGEEEWMGGWQSVQFHHRREKGQSEG